VLGVDVQHDPPHFGLIFVKEAPVIFIDVPRFADPLLQFVRPALEDDILHLAVRGACPGKPHGSPGIPDITYGTGVYGRGNFRKDNIDLPGLLIGFTLADIPALGEQVGFPTLGKKRIFPDLKGYLLSHGDIIIDANDLEEGILRLRGKDDL